MLMINDTILETYEQEIFVGNYTNNGEKGYNVNMCIAFINPYTNKKGYINLALGYDKEKYLTNFINREYKGKPYGDDNQFMFIEVYFNEFLDSDIEGDLTVRFKDLDYDTVETYLELNDKLINIKFKGYLKFNMNRTIDYF